MACDVEETECSSTALEVIGSLSFGKSEVLYSLYGNVVPSYKMVISSLTLLCRTIFPLLRSFFRLYNCLTAFTLDRTGGNMIHRE